MADFKLTLDPADKLLFSSKKLGEEAVSSTLKISNPLKERMAIKVKCTSNEMFRIRPPVAVVKAGENTTINVVFNSGKPVPDNGKHYFAVYYLTAKDEKKTPRQVWSEHKGEPEGTKKIFIDFKKEGGDEEKKDDKKEDKKEEKKDENKDEKKDEKKEEKKEDGKKEEKKDEKKDEKKKDDKEEKKEDEKKEDDEKEEEKKE